MVHGDGRPGDSRSSVAVIASIGRSDVPGRLAVAGSTGAAHLGMIDDDGGPGNTGRGMTAVAVVGSGRMDGRLVV